MTLRTALSGLFISTAVLLAPPARGEAPVLLPPVEVPLPAEPEPEPESPTRRDASSIHSIIRADAHRGEVKDASELISLSPGSVLSDSGGHGQSKTVSLRGAAANGVLVLLDGTPISTQGGGADLSKIPLAIVERFEVMRGGSSRYGSGGLGGVVNVVTRSPRDQTSGAARLTVGAFQTQSAEVSGTSPLLGGDALLVLHGLRTEGNFNFLFDEQPSFDGNVPYSTERLNNDAMQGGVFGRFRRPLGGWQTDVVLEAFADSRGLAGTAQNPTPDARAANQRGTLTLRASRPVGDNVLLSTRTYALLDRLHLEGGFFGVPSAQLLSVYGTEATGEVFLGRHALTVLGTVGAETLAPREGRDAAGWVKAGAMISDDLSFRDGDVLISPSLRVDQVGRFTTLSPKLGAVGKLPSGFSIRANTGQASRAPSFLELYVQQGRTIPNPSLRPERALFADAQLAHETTNSRVAASAFYSLYEDLIAYEVYPPFLIKPFNFRTARVYGLETEGEARPHPMVSVSAGYTLMFSQNLRDDPRYYLKDLPYRPRHKGSLRLTVGPELLRARAEILAQSEQFMNRTEGLVLPNRGISMDRGENLILPRRAFLNVGVSSTLRHSPEVTLSGELKNVLDVQAADLDGYPLPGRAAYLTVAVALDAVPKGQR